MSDPFTLETVYRRHRKSYEGRPDWMWEDEGKYYAVADYYSSSGEFTDADIQFARENGLDEEVAAVISDAAWEVEAEQDKE